MAEKVFLMIGVSGFLGYWFPDLAMWIGTRKTEKSIPLPPYSRVLLKATMVGVSAALAWGVKWRLGTGLEGWLAIFLIWLLLLIVLTDMWFLIIPNLITYGGFFLFMLVRFFSDPMSIDNYLFAVVAITAVLSLVSWISKGLGWGDVKLMAMAAWVIGWPLIFLAVWLATVSSLIYATARIKCQGWQSLRSPIPFGPHLGMGIALALFFGDILWEIIWRIGK